MAAAQMKKCPYCAQMIPLEALVCHLCRRDVDTPESLKLRLESENKRKSTRGTIAIVCIFGFIAWLSLSNKGTNDSNTVNSGSMQSAHKCAVGTPTSGHVLVNKNNVPMMNGAGVETGQLVNERASEGSPQKIYESLWPSTDLEAICELGDWIQIQTVAYGGSSVDMFGKPITRMTGWIEKRFAARELTDNQKLGLYWNIADDKDIPSEDKDWVRKGALRVLSDNKRCKRIDRGRKVTGMVLGVDRTGQYYGTCSDKNERENQLWNVFFSKADVISDKLLAPPAIR